MRASLNLSLLTTVASLRAAKSRMQRVAHGSATLTLASDDFGGQRVERRSPEPAEPVEPRVDVTETVQGSETAMAETGDVLGRRRLTAPEG